MSWLYPEEWASDHKIADLISIGKKQGRGEALAREGKESFVIGSGQD